MKMSLVSAAMTSFQVKFSDACASERRENSPKLVGRVRRVIGLFAWGWLGVIMSGCELPRYYGQAVGGHCRILLRQEPVQDVLAHPGLSPRVEGKLRLVLELRQFADDHLRLPPGGHYLQYAELGEPYVVWNVFAAPEFSLEAKRWWYPVVGRLSYRGYFKETMAQKCAESLRERGMDVFVGGVDAYSTLGWFKDPILDTFLARDELSVADLLFHELAHQKLFVKGDTDFNEAFATAVAREGVRRWLLSKHDDQALANYEVLVARQDAFLDLVMVARDQLEALYNDRKSAQVAEWAESDLAELRRRKADIFATLRSNYETLKSSWEGGVHFDAWFDGSINNARLNAEATYHRLVPAFENLLTALDRDLEVFFGRVAAIGALPESQRQALLAQWMALPADSGWTSLPMDDATYPLLADEPSSE